MISSNEYVSIGHPDSTADAISSHLLDLHLKVDPLTRFAVECQIKDNHVSLAGEVTSLANFGKETITGLVKDAIRKVGYTNEYAARWPQGMTLNADEVSVDTYLSIQSPDIAQGVDTDGWGDQGVFCGMAVNDEKHGYMPLDRYYSNLIGLRLYESALNGVIPIGLDIKTLVTVDENFVCEVVVAAPMMKKDETTARNAISHLIRTIIPNGCGPDKITINGTGSYVMHSSVGDSGTTGRKLAVNFYGLSCPIGGGSPWTKDPTKADLTLNLAARYFALKKVLEDKNIKTCYVKMSCCIGKPDVRIAYFNENWELISAGDINLPPSELISRLKLRSVNYFDLCRDGLFSSVDRIALAEKV